jgi:hypothetical protein
MTVETRTGVELVRTGAVLFVRKVPSKGIQMIRLARKLEHVLDSWRAVTHGIKSDAREA